MFLADRRQERDLKALLGLIALGAQGDAKTIKSQSDKFAESD